MAKASEAFVKGDIVALKSAGPTMTVLDFVPDDPEEHVVCGLSTLYTGYQVHSVRALALVLKEHGEPKNESPFEPGDLVILRSGGPAMTVLDTVPDDPEKHVVCGVCTVYTGYAVHSIPELALQPKPNCFPY